MGWNEGSMEFLVVMDSIEQRSTEEGRRKEGNIHCEAIVLNKKGPNKSAFTDILIHSHCVMGNLGQFGIRIGHREGTEGKEEE